MTALAGGWLHVTAAPIHSWINHVERLRAQQLPLKAVRTGCAAQLWMEENLFQTHPGDAITQPCSANFTHFFPSSLTCMVPL